MPDSRLDQLAAIAKSEKTIYSQIEFVDVAGLVKGEINYHDYHDSKELWWPGFMFHTYLAFGLIGFFSCVHSGAHNGAGLGNKFLANIREVSMILHVVRCFVDPQVSHVDASVDPLRDIEVIETELLLADLQTIGKRVESLEKKVRSIDRWKIGNIRTIRCTFTHDS